MAKVDLARRAEIGREKRARTSALIVEAGAMLLAERPPEALTVDAIVEAADVAKGTSTITSRGLAILWPQWV